MPAPTTHPPLRFVADAMLGRLARWLRILGYDTAYDKNISDEALIEQAIREDRWLLTRDRRLVLRKLLRGRHTLIASDLIEGQLRQLHRDLKIDLDLNHPRDYRCADCNVVLIFISPEVAAPLVPPFVARHYRTFLQCPHCRRVFWPGTHWDDFQKRLAVAKFKNPAGPEWNNDGEPVMKLLSALPLLLFIVLVAMLPFVFGQLFTAALLKLKLDPTTALLVVIGIFLGSPVNIPVKRISRTESVPVNPLAVYGLHGWWPMLQCVRRETMIAVNVGGCIIPVALTVYETAHLVMAGWRPLSGLLLAIFINTVMCYWLAKPIKGIGIAMPGLFPPLLAAASALFFVPDQAPPVAFVAGVLGPLIGADLLHLRDIEKIATGIASIGGAGTFDGIVLSGIVAAYLA